MSPLASYTYLRFIPFMTLVLCLYGGVQGQDDYHIAQYASRQGLPQNSVRGLAFDEHGFLWVATEGGIARFDGRSFRVYTEKDHPGLKNQRFTGAYNCNDTSILFVDLLNGMYILSNDRFTTIQQPAVDNHNFIRLRGNPPDPYFLLNDTFFYSESRHALNEHLETINIMPGAGHTVYIASDRIIMQDRRSKKTQTILQTLHADETAAVLNERLLLFKGNGQLQIHQSGTDAFMDCILTDEAGRTWTRSLAGVRVYNRYPFTTLFFTDGNQLYSLIPTQDQNRFRVKTILDKLPENCTVNEIAYRETDQILVLGTDSRGLFIYHPKRFANFTYPNQNTAFSNAYYAQCLIDSTTLLASNALLVDLPTNTAKGFFPYSFNPYILCKDDMGNIYFAQGQNILRFNLATKQKQQIPLQDAFGTNFLSMIDGDLWIGTTMGIGYIRNDSMHWVHKTSFRGEKHAVQCIQPDTKGNVWFGSYFQLYRLNIEKHQLDSFPMFATTDCRVLKLFRDNLYIGTNGSGFYIYHHDHFVQMPSGRNDELSHTHNFIEDAEGYLWIPTNHGLYKTHLDAIDTYLRDTTLQIDYYGYLEEDGIQSVEFNGGCSPTHIMLPDGRLSLPTIVGLVMFKPEETPHFFSKDTLLIESVTVDGEAVPPGNPILIPSNHTNIKISFAGAWWNRPDNQYVTYKLEGLHETFRLCDIDQVSYTIGHLKPGEYTFVLRRRSGFGPSDFTYTRQTFTVLTPWHMKPMAFVSYGIGFLLIVWGSSVVYTRSIRKRNIELQKKVDEQTTALLSSNSKLEENLRKLEASEVNLRKNIRVRDRLISIITHDILTPLRFIGQIARLGAEDKPEDPGMAKRALTDVQNAIHKLFHSTQNLLHWVSYQQEKFKTVSINCSPFAIVEQLMEDFKEMSRFQGNTLINEVPEDDVILADPNVLTIVLHNLLSNAIKYTHQGRIVVRSGIEHSWYLLEVRDTGRGMTATQLETIRKGTALQGDTTLEDVTAGNGIGLTLVADLMRTLNGRWEIDSPEQGGTRVRIFLSLNHPSNT